ncbi:MAG TPA: FlgD immunoglobulin-like domain containing protein [Candidatus Krumholzibacteria bacterium]|nr:FlgD immunoglobulin-like domain containing protein [Candidatus Krumholzibacteria bacterium]
MRPDGAGDYPTIQDAVNGAANGDSIVLAPGRFTGPGNRDVDTMGKAIVITSRDGPDVTEIDAEEQARVFHIHRGETNTTVISNITINHGFADADSGAGIRCDGGSPRLCDLVFGPSTDLALAIVNSDVDIIRCRFADIAIPGYRWPVHAALNIDRSSVRLIDCAISWFGAYSLRASNSDVVMIGNTFEHGGQFYVDGVLLLEDCAVSILGNVVRNNYGSTGTGIALHDCTGEVRGNWIENNGAQIAGGGVEWTRSTGDVSFNLLRENSDGGIRSSGTGSIIRNLVVRTQNACCSAGTAINVYGCGAVNVENNTLFQNGTDFYPDVPGAEMTYVWLSAQVHRNVIVGRSHVSWVVCNDTPGGCTSALLSDTIYVDDDRNLLFGDPAGLAWTRSELCFDNSEVGDPLFCDEANDNFFLQPGSPAMIELVGGNYHITRAWGALPVACGPSDVLDVHTPPGDNPVGVQPGDEYPLVGFSIKNTSPLDAVVNYRLSAVGGVLRDNGDPLSLVGTTPVLPPGESFVPPPAAIVVPDGNAIIEVKYAFAYAPALNIADTVRTTLYFGTPVSVRVTSFAASVGEGGVRLSWGTAPGTSEDGWLIYRAAGNGAFVRLTSVALVPGTRTFLDVGAHAGVRYRYRLVALDPDERIAGEIDVTPSARLTLEQNAPNPFNPETTIRFSLPASAHVVLAVYGVSGAHVRTIVDRSLPGGEYHEIWDGRDARGNLLPSGIYMYRLAVGTRTLTRKMVLAK